MRKFTIVILVSNSITTLTNLSITSAKIVENVFTVSYYVCMENKRKPRPELIPMGENIARERDREGLKQQQLATRILYKTGMKITRSQIQQYESGYAEPPGTKL